MKAKREKSEEENHSWEPSKGKWKRRRRIYCSIKVKRRNPAEDEQHKKCFRKLMELGVEEDLILSS
jgi:hypothetical protein